MIYMIIIIEHNINILPQILLIYLHALDEMPH